MLPGDNEEVVRLLGAIGLLALWALTFYAYFHLPTSIPAHWNAQGEVTRYGSRLEIFLLPLFVTFLLYPLLALAPRLGGRPSSIWPWLEAAMVWNFVLLQGVFLYAAWAQAQGIPFSMGRAIFVVVGLVLLVLGLLLPHLPPNPWVGVRTPGPWPAPPCGGKPKGGRAGSLPFWASWPGWWPFWGGKGPWLWTWLLALVLGGLYLVLFSLWAGKGEKRR